jgi:hypothetical protein
MKTQNKRRKKGSITFQGIHTKRYNRQGIKLG